MSVKCHHSILRSAGLAHYCHSLACNKQDSATHLYLSELFTSLYTIVTSKLVSVSHYSEGNYFLLVTIKLVSTSHYYKETSLCYHRSVLMETSLYSTLF